LGEAITIIFGIIFTGMSTYGAFYIKKLTDDAKRKALVDEVNRYTQWALQAKSFKLMNIEEKKQTVFEKAQQFAMENGISISMEELSLMVEKSVQSIEQLEDAGLKIMKLKREMAKLDKDKGEG
jgi:light-regulated signal transduction histidine kinase (bacteriophytochrome)